MASGLSAILTLVLLVVAARGARMVWLNLVWVTAAWWLPWPAMPLLSSADIAWPGAFGALVGAVALGWMSRRWKISWVAAFALIEGLMASLWWTLVLAKQFSTGGGEERVLTALALVCGLYGGLIVIGAERLTGAGPKLIRGLAVGLLGLALLFCSIGMASVDDPGAVDIALAVIGLGAVAAFAALLALRHDRGWALYLTEGALLGLYAYLRGATELLDGLNGYDSVVIAGLGFLYLGLSRWLATSRSQLGAAQGRRLAALVPLLVPLAMEWNGDVGDFFGSGLAAGSYSWMARSSGKQRFSWLAAVLFNLALIPVWIRLDLEGATAYLFPAGLSVLTLTHLYRERLDRSAPVLRSLASLLMLGSSSVDLFQFDAVWPALVMGGIAIGAVLLGIVWRLRAYLYMGFAFLILDIVVNITRYSLGDRLIMGIVGVVSGVALFVLGVVVARHKEELLRRYRVVTSWDW